MKGIVKWLLITAGVFYILTLIVGALAPSLLRSAIISRVAELGLHVGKLTVSSVGLSKTELRDIEISDETKPILTADTVSVDYSLFKLLGGTAKQIIITGAVFHPDNLPSLPEQESSGSDAPGFAVNHLRLRSSRVEMTLAGSSLIIPLEVDLKKDSGSHRYTIDAQALPFGDTWSCVGALDAAKGNGELTVKSTSFKPQYWTSRLMPEPPLIMASTAEAVIDIKLSKWSLQGAIIQGSAATSDIAFPPYTARAHWNVSVSIPPSLKPENLKAFIDMQSLQGPDFTIEQPFVIKINGASPDRFTVQTSDVFISNPIPILIKSVDGELTLAGDPMEFTGRYTIEWSPDNLAAMEPLLKIDRSLQAAGEFTVLLPPLEAPWNVKGTVGQPMTVTGDRLKSSINRLTASYSLDGNGQALRSNILLNAAGIRLTLSDLTLKGKNIKMRAAVTGSDAEWDSSGQITLSGIDAGIGDQITINNLSAVIPFQGLRHAKQEITQAGDFKADSMDIAGLVLSQLKGRLGVGPGLTEAVGQAELPVKPLVVNYNGEHKITPGLDSYSLNFDIPPTQLPPHTSLAPLHPFLDGITAAGTVAGAGRLEGTGELFSGTGEFRVSNFQLAVEEMGVKLAGINGTVRFRDLPGLLSEPAQEMTIRQLDAQGIPFRDGRVVFTSEGNGVVLVEKAEFELLGGKVFFGGVRVGGEKSTIDTVLYCDRIDFDRLLNVLIGETIASGDAEINGVIPLTLSESGPVFKKGFLYSSPGIQGALQIQDASLISGGMVLVEEAVRDFNYEWVRVKLDSKNDRLDMNLVIKGVPATRLPLEYDGKKGDFVRSPTGKRMVNLKGLTLELKFVDIDLGQLLKEGGRVKLMTDKKQKRRK